MKIKLELNCENEEDKLLFEKFMKAEELFNAVEDIKNHLRRLRKYGSSSVHMELTTERDWEIFHILDKIIMETLAEIKE